MVEYSGESGDPGEKERMQRNHDALRSNWERTVEDMRAMAEDRRSNGYEAHTVAAQDTAPVSPKQEVRDYWGLSHLVPDNKVDTIEEYLEAGEFEETGVYQADAAGTTFMVTECIDHDSGLVLYVAGSFWMQDAPTLVEAATERGTMYTQFRTIDGTHVGGIEHDDAGAFFPDPDKYLAFRQNR